VQLSTKAYPPLTDWAARDTNEISSHIWRFGLFSTVDGEFSRNSHADRLHARFCRITVTVVRVFRKSPFLRRQGTNQRGPLVRNNTRKEESGLQDDSSVWVPDDFDPGRTRLRNRRAFSRHASGW